MEGERVERKRDNKETTISVVVVVGVVCNEERGKRHKIIIFCCV